MLEQSDDHLTNPSHYSRYSVQPIDFIMENGMEFWRGNVVKYISRAGHKLYDGKDFTGSELADLRKAAQYINFRINQLNDKKASAR